jgi:hypothetical protein
MLQFFVIYWPYNILRDIVIETNRYATEDLGDGKTYGGVDWEPLTVPGLKAFIVVLLYMGSVNPTASHIGKKKVVYSIV